MKKQVLAGFLFLIATASFSQIENNLTLNIEQFLEIVRKNHPVVKQSNINIEKAKADITIAKAAFNPIIGGVVANKTFKDVNYYNSFSPTIVIPTWFGVEVSAGYNDLIGSRLDPSETDGQTNFIGISIPLLKNLILDKRRAYRKQAFLFKDMSIIEQRALTNNILMDASTQYWEWVTAYQYLEIINKNLIVSQKRVELIKKTVDNGERPAIDSVEATVQYQSFEYQQNEAKLKLLTEKLQLDAFLWKPENEPYVLPENVIPQQGWDNELNIKNFNLNLKQLLANSKEFHPELQMYSQKIKILEIEKRLKFQDLLPKLDFKYNHLGKGTTTFNSDGLLFNDNFQYGLKLEIPLFFSEGRGGYKKTKLKINETKINQTDKAYTIELKVKNYFNEFTILKEQVALQKNMLFNFQKLLTAEETMFQNGESSLFLINARENKVLETERKLIETKTKYYKTIYGLQWSAGLLR